MVSHPSSLHALNETWPRVIDRLHSQFTLLLPNAPTSTACLLIPDSSDRGLVVDMGSNQSQPLVHCSSNHWCWHWGWGPYCLHLHEVSLTIVSTSVSSPDLFLVREISTPKLRGTLVILMPAAANTGWYLFISSFPLSFIVSIIPLNIGRLISKFSNLIDHKGIEYFVCLAGNLLMYILGWALPWRLTTLPGALIPILPILLLALIPESPSWLLSRGRREEATQSLARCIWLWMKFMGTNISNSSSHIQRDLSMASQPRKKRWSCVELSTVIAVMALFITPITCKCSEEKLGKYRGNRQNKTSEWKEENPEWMNVLVWLHEFYDR